MSECFIAQECVLFSAEHEVKNLLSVLTNIFYIATYGDMAGGGGDTKLKNNLSKFRVCLLRVFFKDGRSYFFFLFKANKNTCKKAQQKKKT